MNKRLIHSSIVALIFVVALTSCNRQNVPELVSTHRHFKEKSNKQADESTVALQQRDKLESIPAKAPQELQTPSVNEELHPIAAGNRHLAFAPKHAKTHSMPLLNETDIKTDLSNGFAKTQNKSADSKFSHHDGDRLLCAIIAIFIPFLGVGLYEGLTVNFWVDLILTFLFYFPGLIFALIVILSD